MLPNSTPIRSSMHAAQHGSISEPENTQASQWEQQARRTSASSALRKTVIQMSKKSTFDPTVSVEDAARAARESVAAEYSMESESQPVPPHRRNMTQHYMSDSNMPYPNAVPPARRIQSTNLHGSAMSDSDVVLAKKKYFKESNSRWSARETPRPSNWKRMQHLTSNVPTGPSQHYAPAEHPTTQTHRFESGLRRRAGHQQYNQPMPPTTPNTQTRIPTTPATTMLGAAYQSTRATARRATRAPSAPKPQHPHYNSSGARRLSHQPTQSNYAATQSRQQSAVKEKKQRDETQRLIDSACSRLWDPDGDIEMFLRMSSFAVGLVAAGTFITCDQIVASVCTLVFTALFCGVFTRAIGSFLWRRSSGLESLVLNALVDGSWKSCIKARSEGRAVCMGEIGRIVAVSRAVPNPEQRFVVWVELCCYFRVSLETSCDLLGPRRGGTVCARDIVLYAINSSPRMVGGGIGSRGSARNPWEIPTRRCASCAQNAWST